MEDIQSKPPYQNAPLAAVVLEVRFPEQPEPLSRREQALLRQELGELLPLVENVKQDQVEVALGTSIPTSVRRRSFPRFVTRDRTTALVVNDTAMILETTQYDGYQKFRELALQVVNGVSGIVRPNGVLRVGLRYIDEVRVPSISELPGDWGGYIDQHLLAAVDPGFLPDRLTPATWQGLVEYSTGPDSTLTLRYGPRDGYAFDPKGATRRKNFPKPGPYFLLDSDSYWLPGEEVPEFDATFVIDTCDTLHTPVQALFHVAVTDRLRDEVFSKARVQER